MPRRPSSKIDSGVEETEGSAVTSTLKKRQTTVKAEPAKQEAEIIQHSPAKIRNKLAKVNVDFDNRSLISGKESISSIKINRVKAKAAPEETKDAKQRPRKRTATADDDEDSDEKKANTVIKRRKTKAERESEAMPLALRTAVRSLKHAMHIGAHVSAAGGQY